MILRATSDLHLTQRTAPWVMAALAEMRLDAEANGGVTLILGDILDQPHTVHMRSYLALRKLLHDWPGMFYVLAGNHDQFGMGFHNGLEALHGGSCEVISEPTWTDIGMIVPYTKPEDFKATLDALKPTCVALKLVWCHHGFKGAYVNAMITDRTGVSCQDIPDGYVVVSGHYHMPQNLGRIVYTGSPYETSFAEEGQAKGWLRWADATKELFPVRIPFGDIGSPRHVTIHWSPADGPPEVPKGMRSTDRPRIKTDATRKEAQEYSDQLRAVGLAGVPILAAPNVGGERRVVETSLGPKDAVGRYVTTVYGADPSQPDPDEMTEYADEENLWGA